MTNAHHGKGVDASVFPSPEVTGTSKLGEELKQILDLPPDVLSVIMGYLPNVSDRFRLASPSKYFRSALRNPRAWETLISCECGTRYALDHAPDLWLKGLEKCVFLGCDKNICSRGYCRFDNNGPRALSCSICEKVW